MTLVSAIRKTRIPEEIVGQISQLVHDGVLKPGDQLPPERELAQQMNVSRASVREAMRLLDTTGVVVVRPGAGTFVAEDSIQAIVDAVSSRRSNGNTLIRDTFEMRLLLEPHVASLAAERATEGHIVRMRQLLDAQEADILQGGTGVEFDSKFHFAIANATNNHALVAITEAISDILSRSREISLLSPERSQLSHQSHLEILEGIESGRRKQAEEAMYQHIERIDREVHNLSSKRVRGNDAASPPAARFELSRIQ